MDPHHELPNDDADRFSEQLYRLEDALYRANQSEPACPEQVYKKTASPSCSPTRPAIN